MAVRGPRKVRRGSPRAARPLASASSPPPAPCSGKEWRRRPSIFRRWQGLLAAGLARRRESGELAVAVITALQGGYLLAEAMQDERPFTVSLDMALDT